MIAKTVLVIALSSGVIATGVLGYASYYDFKLESRISANPLVGKWKSDKKLFGQYEYLEFSEQGIVNAKRFYAADYEIDGKFVNVIGRIETVSYKVINPDLIQRKFPRVGRIRYNRL